MAEILPYGSWRSAITSDLIVGETVGLLDVAVDGDDIYWIEGRPSEGGRNILVRRSPDGGHRRNAAAERAHPGARIWRRRRRGRTTGPSGSPISPTNGSIDRSRRRRRSR